jgi:phenylalanyl-tRNA synthetase beta chain
MPVITVKKKELVDALGGEKFTDDEFRELCFEFGIELDDVVIDGEEDTNVDNAPDELKTYKIEIPANRYDLLCLEGLARALRLFQEKDQELPSYHLTLPTDRPLLRMVVDESVKEIRRYVVCAVLRDVHFTQASYERFIGLQEKLHDNICRKRTLVSIGTHDLDTVDPPFVYKALPPKEIKFVPLLRDRTLLKQKEGTAAATPKLVDAQTLMEELQHDPALKGYLHILEGHRTYPVILDARNRVLSLPPIINGNHSRMSAQTRNVLVEVTATDRTKALIVLDTITSMFAQYCRSDPFGVEPVEIEDGARIERYPQWDMPLSMTCSVQWLSQRIGIHPPLPMSDIVRYLRRMSLPARPAPTDPDTVVVTLPPTRSDILHACDIMEDCAIAYGYNRLTKTAPRTLTIGSQQPLNKLTDQLRVVLANAGYDEALSFTLCSKEENFKMLRRSDDHSAVVIANPKTQHFQIARTSLLVGLLLTLRSNQKLALPIKLFEVSDIVVKNALRDVGAENKRVLCALHCDKTSGFEHIHGLLDYVMQSLEVTPLLEENREPAPSSQRQYYYLQPSDDPTYLPGRCADIFIVQASKTPQKVGVFGILHPTVLKYYNLQYPCSALHLFIEPFL